MDADADDTSIARTYDAVYATLRDPSGDVRFYPKPRRRERRGGARARVRHGTNSETVIVAR